MSAGDLALVLAQLLLFALVGWSTARLLQRVAGLGDLGVVERAALVPVGFLCFSVAAMLFNVVSRGAVFANAAAVPLLACVPVVLWARTGLARSDARELRGARWRGALLLGAALAALYFLPVLLAGSGVRTGDPPWHLGWTEQLLGGEPVPVGPAAELARNAYPWGYHAALAGLVRLVPSSTPLLAHETVHVVLLAAIPLVAAGLARRVHARAGVAAAACTSLVGGFGWVLAREPAFEPSPRAGRFGADLVAASPNSVYELLPPAMPREVGLVVAGAAALLLVLAIERGTPKARVAGGAVAGLVGVVSVPMLFTALAWAATGIFFVRRGRLRALVQLAVPALVVFALWAAPVALGYLRHGGFVDITPRLGMEWPLPTALGSYGLLLPLAAGGVVAAARTAGGRVLVALVCASTALLGLAVARDVFDWSVWNNATLLHQGRMWPPVHLLAGALGGVAVVHLYEWLRGRGRVVAAVAAGAGLLVAAASPVLASLRMKTILEEDRAGYVYGDGDYAPGSFARAAGEVLGPDDVVAGGSYAVLWALFQMSGARLAHYDDPRLDGNDLRIRYADLAEAWNEGAAAGRFRPTHLVVPAGPGSVIYREILAEGEFGGERWALVEVSEGATLRLCSPACIEGNP
ncbi:MAG TPA: hypothetical protein VHN37_01445 [Actinomycetota bacterium]|nr:hypothetical protein [Actinomycetota bacterium]